MPPPPHDRLFYDDAAELRTAVRDLLDHHAWTILWSHILERGHDVAEREIRAALYLGRYEPSRQVPGRYIAIRFDEPLREKVRVVFEIRRGLGGRHLVVVTAYTRGGP